MALGRQRSSGNRVDGNREVRPENASFDAAGCCGSYPPDLSDAFMYDILVLHELRAYKQYESLGLVWLVFTFHGLSDGLVPTAITVQRFSKVVARGSPITHVA